MSLGFFLLHLSLIVGLKGHRTRDFGVLFRPVFAGHLSPVGCCLEVMESGGNSIFCVFMNLSCTLASYIVGSEAEIYCNNFNHVSLRLSVCSHVAAPKCLLFLFDFTVV